jgi:hypothetical protein
MLLRGVVLGVSVFACGAMADALPTGHYTISLEAGGMALEAEASGMSRNDGKVHLWQNNDGGPTQVWSVERPAGSAGEGIYTILLAATRKSLDADGPTIYSDGKIHLWDYNAGPTQKWRIEAAGSNTYTVILAETIHQAPSRVLFDKVLDIAIKAMFPGARALDAAVLSMNQNDGLVHLWEANGGKTQKWVFTPVTPIPQTNSVELTTAPTASAAEIAEFNDVVTNQNGVGVLGGDNTQPFYFHDNLPAGSFYKYKKLIDVARLPAGYLDHYRKSLSNNIVNGSLGALQDVLDAADWVKDEIFGDGSTMKYIDTWYPVTEIKQTVCGTVFGGAVENGKEVKGVEMCEQDYLHTRVTVDKDFNIHLSPSPRPRFEGFLHNRHIKGLTERLEGEVRLNAYGSGDALTTRNPLPMQIKIGTKACMYGPWMADSLESEERVPIPFSADKVDLDLVKITPNNEIHPINQLWFRKSEDEIELLAFGDGGGYFDKQGRGEIEASGLNHPMRFYVAFQLPKRGGGVVGSGPGGQATTARPAPAAGGLAGRVTGTGATGEVIMPGAGAVEYDINGGNYQVTTSPVRNVAPKTLQLTINNEVALRVNDNSQLRTEKSHNVFFDKVRVRPDGGYQGYIVVETVPIVSQGGSINVNVKISQPLGPPQRIPRDTVIRKQ